MQRTRLSTLVMKMSQQLSQWLFNPWRRLSIVALSLLLGYFFANAISLTTGQAAKWEIIIAGFLLIIVELISWIFYRSPIRSQADAGSQRALITEMLNAFKMGMTYGLFVEAFKLGS